MTRMARVSLMDHVCLELSSCSFPFFEQSVLDEDEPFTYGPNNASLIIRANVLTTDQSYRFKVSMTNRDRPSLQIEGIVVVKVVEKPTNLVAIS